MTITDSSAAVAVGDSLGRLPRFALYKRRKVRIIGYDKDALRPILILDRGDERRSVTREQLVFLPGKKK